MDKDVEIDKNQKPRKAGVVVMAWGLVALVLGTAVALLGPLVILFWRWALG